MFADFVVVSSKTEGNWEGTCQECTLGFHRDFAASLRSTESTESKEIEENF